MQDHRRHCLRAIIVVAVLILYSGSQVSLAASNHLYRTGDAVSLYANKVGPYNNPSETYHYYDLPFCSQEGKKENLGGVLNGGRLVSTMYKLDFLMEKSSEVVCKKKLKREEVSKFQTAIAKDYYFEMYSDDLPIWGFIGQVSPGKSEPNVNNYFIFNHLHFEIFYNKDHVIGLNVSVDQGTKLKENKELEFLYTVKWKKTDTPFETRLDIYLENTFLRHHMKVHGSSIMFSCVKVLLLTGCLILFYMRVLKNDFINDSHNEESGVNQEEKGWKCLHGDVFRYPSHKSLFAAALGSGTQLLILTILILILGLFGVFYTFDGVNIVTALVVIYSITFGISGYTAAYFYCWLEGTNWVKNLVLTGCLFCGPLLFTFWFLTSVAIAYNSTAALPFGMSVVIVLTCTLVASLFLVLGGITGKNSKADFQAPCRTTKCPREIPPLPWYRGSLAQMALAGVLPFSVIYTQLYYIFRSMWGYRIYTLYSILFVVFIILLIVIALVNMALTYCQLAAEDHKWWWRSFICGGSTGLYIFGYSLYYYFEKSNMSGFMQISFFFGSMTCICFGVFLMLGTLGFLASLLFVRHIYQSIKCD